MSTGYERGHKIFYDGCNWRYFDNGKIIEDKRPCIRCGKYPNADDSDACIGHLDNVVAACCGHGKYKGYIRYTDGREEEDNLYVDDMFRM
jgi:hypothetical protein